MKTELLFLEKFISKSISSDIIDESKHEITSDGEIIEDDSTNEDFIAIPANLLILNLDGWEDVIVGLPPNSYITIEGLVKHPPIGFDIVVKKLNGKLPNTEHFNYHDVLKLLTVKQIITDVVISEEKLNSKMNFSEFKKLTKLIIDFNTFTHKDDVYKKRIAEMNLSLSKVVPKRDELKTYIHFTKYDITKPIIGDFDTIKANLSKILNGNPNITFEPIRDIDGSLIEVVMIFTSMATRGLLAYEESIYKIIKAFKV